MDHSCLLVILLLSVTQACVCTFHTVALMARKPVSPNNCHILMCSVRGISASLSPTIREEIEVTGLTGSRLVSQQEGPVQLLRPQQTEGTRQLGHLGRLLPPTSWVWLWFLRGQMRLFQSPSLIWLENKNKKQNQNNPKSEAIFPFLKFLPFVSDPLFWPIWHQLSVPLFRPHGAEFCRCEIISDLNDKQARLRGMVSLGRPSPGNKMGR